MMTKLLFGTSREVRRVMRAKEDEMEGLAPFAILMLNNLRVVRFQTKDEMIDAMRNLKARDIECLAFRHWPETDGYTPIEAYS